MFSKYKVDSKPSHCQPLLYPLYALSSPLAADQPFDKWKEKIKPGIYLGMSQIHERTVSLVLSFVNGKGITTVPC